MMEKKRYETISLEILRFADDDIITQSGETDNLGGWHDGWLGGIFENTEADK